MQIIAMNELKIGDVIAPLEEFTNWKEEKVKHISKINDIFFIDINCACISFHETDKVILIERESITVL